MTFKREISIDGVAVIVAAVSVIVFLVTLNITQKAQGDLLSQHSDELHQISVTQSSLADSIAVLTAVVNERTGHAVVLPTPHNQ